MFNKILVANRGEIACRIMRTARKLGLQTVAVYSTVDQNSLHVKEADEAYCIGEAPAKDSYLNINAIIEAARISQADAIHPGYGFLSENPEFAFACEKAGIIFIGPTVSAMQAMASKQLAKQLLEKTSVPLVPGYHGDDQSHATLLKEAQKIGFPVLLKAAAGGGGKGMRAVYELGEFDSALAGAKREATASFGDDVMIIEKLISNPRHIEVQIMADSQGQVVHLFERDCSIQRRHQKIIEEAPAPGLKTSVRDKITKAACEVAKTIHYLGAGTVEFLLGDDDSFYFMEMNTRLQVEHPVTEMITGQDLVAWQIHIAQGKPLPLSQNNITMQGHAIECRVYAEDPSHDFLPSTGQINFLKQPEFQGVRIDTGITLHSTISKYYDPMIAKLIVYGDTREESLGKLKLALTHYCIGGVKTNIPFLMTICNHPRYQQAKLGTDFLTRETLELPEILNVDALQFACAFDYCKLVAKNQDPIFRDSFSWQMHLPTHWIWKYRINQQVLEVKISPIDNHRFKFQSEDKICHLHAELSGDRLRVTDSSGIKEAEVQLQDKTLTLYYQAAKLSLEHFTWDRTDTHANQQKGQLTAPMPATVVAILKNVGETVKTGERLMVLEAMKMEHTIHAPVNGILRELFYPVGAQVNEGAELLSLEESPE